MGRVVALNAIAALLSVRVPLAGVQEVARAFAAAGVSGGSAVPGDTMVIGVSELTELVVAALTSRGVPVSSARTQAQALIEGELRGHPSHGVQRLATLLSRIDNGVIEPAAVPTGAWVTSSVFAVDGHFGFGPVSARFAIDEIAVRAEHSGIAAALISRSGHVGMLAIYAEELAHRGLIGLTITTSEALVHAWNGSSAIVGTNPIGIAVPTTADPFVLDMSTAEVSVGKIIHYAAMGQPLEHGWAVDAAGEPTLDASAARSGALTPFGGPKGFGLGLAVELIVGLLTRGALGTDVHGTLDTDQFSTKGDVFIAISPSAVGVGEDLGRLTEYLEAVRNTAAAGCAVRIPGDRSRQTREARLADGLQISTSILHDIIGQRGSTETKATP